MFLTGAFEGGPYGLAVVVPAIAGPFNLGTVVVRQSIRVDQGAGCQALAFGLRLRIVLSGKGKTRAADHPTLTATLSQPSGKPTSTPPA